MRGKFDVIGWKVSKDSKMSLVDQFSIKRRPGAASLVF